MIRVRTIDSIDLPELEPYRSMRWQQEQRRSGCFVAEGDKVVRRLLESDFGVVSLLIPDKWLPAYQPLVENRPECVDVFVAPKSELEKITGFALYQGVLAVGRIPQRENLGDWLNRPTRPRLYVAAEGICNAENVGVLIRNCAAFGAHGFIAGETSASPFLRRAVRSSMGTVFRLPILEALDLRATLRLLRNAGVWLVAAHPAPDGGTLSHTNLRGDCCLLFGSEGDGISQALRAECDARVAIPMHAGVDSLNVASASAVFLYETQRQRETDDAP